MSIADIMFSNEFTAILHAYT